MLAEGDRVSFIEMKDGTEADYRFLDAQWQAHFDADSLKRRVLGLLEEGRGPTLGYPGGSLSARATERDAGAPRSS